MVPKLMEVYGGDVEKLDLLVGTLAEENRPTKFGFGETMFQIFILNATRRLQADRFYTDCYTEEYYTKEGLKWIDDTFWGKLGRKRVRWMSYDSGKLTLPDGRTMEPKGDVGHYYPLKENSRRFDILKAKLKGKG